jgi:hypothetical protein
MTTNKNMLGYLFMHDFFDHTNQFAAPSHTSEFNPISYGKGGSGKSIKAEKWAKSSQKQKNVITNTKTKKWAKSSQKRKDGTTLTKAETRAKPYQKVRQFHHHHYPEGQSSKKNTKVNMKTNMKLNVSWR